MAAAATYEEIAQLVGDLDEPTLDRIREVGASVAEVAEAVHRLRDGAPLDEPPAPVSSTRVAEVRAILEEHAAPPHGDAARPIDPRPLYGESVTSD